MANENVIEELTVKLIADYDTLVRDTKTGVDKSAQELDKLSEPPKKAQGAFEKFGSYLKNNFTAIVAGVIAILAGAVVQANKMRDAAIALEKATFSLAASANAANQEFGDAVGTLESWKVTLKELGGAFSVFSNRELSSAASMVLDMTKRLGLNKDQMVELLKRTADLAVGKTDLIDAISRTTAAMRGEAEAGEFLGLSLNEDAVKAYAEAHGLLWEKLTDAEKAQERFALFLQQTEQFQGRAAAFAKTQAGNQAEVNAQIENSNALIGQQLLPLYQAWAMWIGKVAEETEDKAGVITRTLASLSAALATVAAGYVTMANTAVAAFKILAAGAEAVKNLDNPITAITKAFEENKGALMGYIEFVKDVPGIFARTRDELIKQQLDQQKAAEEFGIGTPGGGQGPVLPGVDSAAAQEAFQQLSIELLDLQRDLAKRQEQLVKEHTEAEIQLIMDHGKEVTKLEKELGEERVAVAEETAEALIQLAEETAEAETAARDAAREDIATLETETQSEVDKIREEARETERRETQDHQREMSRLHNSYLMDLTDAVAARDARAIVDLRRKYAAEKREREEDFRTQQTRNREDTRERVEAAREAEEKRRQEIERSLEKQLADIEKNEQEQQEKILASQQEQLDALKEKEEEKRAALDESLAEQLAKEQEHYAEAKAALDGAMAERMAAIGEELAAETEMESEHAQQILELLGERYGAELEALEAFNERKREMMEAQLEWERAQMAQSMATPEGEPGGRRFGMGTTRGEGLPQFQQGGVVPGRRGEKRLIVAHAGELILPLEESSRFMEQRGHAMAANMTGRQEPLVIEFRGSAPPGIGGNEVEAIAGTLVQALNEAGIRARRK